MFESIKYVSAGKFESNGDWTHPNRIIDTHELIFMVQGEAVLCEAFAEYKLSAGDALLLEPGKRHYGSRTEHSPVSFYWLHFSGEFNIDKLPKLWRFEDSAQLSQLFRQLLHYANTSEYPSETADYLTRVILIELSVCGSQNTGGSNAAAAAVAEWIRSNRARRLTVSECAEHFGYNVDYLTRLFKQAYSMGVKSFIDTVRLNYVKELLLSTQKMLKEIAADSGFADADALSKFFRENEDISPARFRKLYYNTHINNH